MLPAGVVEISPSPVAAVCQEGDQLELICTSSERIHSANLNGTVVNCFEGSSSIVSVATTTIRIIDPGQFGKIIVIYYNLRSGMMILYSGLLLAHICILDYEIIIQIAIIT